MEDAGDHGVSRAGSMDRRRGVRGLQAGLLAFVSGPVALGAGMGAAGASPAAPAASATPSVIFDSRFPVADPDVSVDFTPAGARYVIVGTSRYGGALCGQPPQGIVYVPYTTGGECIEGDALPSGPGSWADPGSDIWAPSIMRTNAGFVLLYAAAKPSGQRCIGRAFSTSITGPYGGQTEFACPPGGRWAIDPDGFAGNYVTYRDDYITTGDETGVSVVQTDDYGAANWDTRRDALLSTDITWGWAATGTHVVENPSMLGAPDGHWYLLFSGGTWDSPDYATGVADCGTAPLPQSRCKPLVSKDHPYWAYRPDGGGGFPRQLPGNHPGPGGMDVVNDLSALRAVWHWWDPGTQTRYLTMGTVTQGPDGFSVS
jgi:arabinan endo-1,5-alpha-L-arabinosidase